MMDKNNTLKRDIRDIGYFIDHVSNLKLRESAIVALGYSIGYNVVKGESPIKSVVIGKKGEHRVQIANQINGYPLVKCAIIKNT